MDLPPNDRSERLNRLIAEYLEAVQAGREPDRAKLVGQNPDVADSLRDFFANHDRLRNLAGLTPDAAGPDAGEHSRPSSPHFPHVLSAATSPTLAPAKSKTVHETPHTAARSK